MLKLDLQKKPYWLELPAGIRVKVRPFTSALMNAAQLSVKKQIEALREEHQLRREAGADLRCPTLKMRTRVLAGRNPCW
ncbi:MAG: hypothetical protein EAZ66_06560 [Alphaproteobacteria bacterium]|nr:MAG: hypothetical protein EAZ66_06560 [Alphaproteobacteria bacterium]